MASETVSFSGRRVAAMRRRRSSRSSAGKLTRKERMSASFTAAVGIGVVVDMRVWSS